MTSKAVRGRPGRSGPGTEGRSPGAGSLPGHGADIPAAGRDESQEAGPSPSRLTTPRRPAAGSAAQSGLVMATLLPRATLSVWVGGQPLTGGHTHPGPAPPALAQSPCLVQGTVTQAQRGPCRVLRWGRARLGPGLAPLHWAEAPVQAPRVHTRLGVGAALGAWVTASLLVVVPDVPTPSRTPQETRPSGPEWGVGEGRRVPRPRLQGSPRPSRPQQWVWPQASWQNSLRGLRGAHFHPLPSAPHPRPRRTTGSAPPRS